MTEQFANFANSTLASSINASQTTITVVKASSFPLLGNFRIVVQTFDPLTGLAISNPELMLVTSVAGNQFTVQRGIENTTAIAFAAGSSVAHILTAAVMQGFASAGVSSLNSLTGTLSLTSTGNTVTITPSGSSIDLEIQNSITNSLSLSKFRAAIAGVKAGVANTRILFIGDSETIGINSAGVSNWPNFSDILATYLNNAGIPANKNGWIGDSSGTGNTGSRDSVDSRLSIGAWNANIAVPTAGGASFATASSATLTYTPGNAVDTFNVFYPQYGGGGIMSIQATGGTLVNLNESLTGQLSTGTAIAGSLSSSNVLTVSYVSGSTTFLFGAEAYNSAIKSVNIMNGGWWGTKVADWASIVQFYSSQNMIAYLAPSLLVITAGANDWSAGTSIASFKANLQSIITAAVAAGSDVILMPDAPNSTVSLPTQQTYVNALYDLATTNSLLVVDTFKRWVSYTVSNPLGYYSDTIHPTTKGYQDWAETLFSTLIDVVGGGIVSPGGVASIDGLSGTVGITSPDSSVTIGTSGNNITLKAALNWNEITTTIFAISPNNGYICNNASQVVGTLPATAAKGDYYRIAGKGAGGWKVAQNSGQTIHFDSNNTTTGVSGFLASQTTFDCIEILCITANTDFLIISSIGNITGN